MSSEAIISVEGLGKRYTLGTQRSGSDGRYKTLRDTMTQTAANTLRRLRPAQREPETDPRDFWALRDVSFKVKPGEVVGIIGRNGAGKSTLLKILSRITEPTAGRVSLAGRVASLLEVGTGFHPELTGRENIFLNGAILGMQRIEIRAKFDEIVAFAEVERFLDTPVKRYSSGMYVRLAFAVAAHLEPEILIIDEVLAVGDAEFQKKCLGKMQDVAGAGRTVLFVSHQMNAIEQLCTRAVMLKAGRLQADGPDVRAIVQSYLQGPDEAGNREAAQWANNDGQFANAWFQPSQMLITNEAGEPAAMPLANDADLWLQIRAQVTEIDPALTIGYAIYTESNELLYWSYQTDEAQERWPTLAPGAVTLRGRIPARFLNEGAYRIELIGGLHHREWLFEPNVNAPSIFIQVRGKLSDSPLWLEKRPGLLAPVLRWESLS